MQNQKVHETSLKATQSVEQSKLGYEKHVAIHDSLNEQHIIQVMNKADLQSNKVKAKYKLNKERKDTI